MGGVEVTAIKLLPTRDVSREVLAELVKNAQPEVALELTDEAVSFKSGEAPSFVSLLADFPIWKALFVAPAATYLVTLAKSMANDHWENREKVRKQLAGLPGEVRRLASSLAVARKAVAPATRFGVGFPVPNEYFSTVLTLQAQSEDELLLELAVFRHHLDALSALLESHIGEGIEPATTYFLRIETDLALRVEWHDANDLTIRSTTFRL